MSFGIKLRNSALLEIGPARNTFGKLIVIRENKLFRVAPSMVLISVTDLGHSSLSAYQIFYISLLKLKIIGSSHSFFL